LQAFGFEAFNSFLRKRRRLIIAAWVIALVIAGSQVPTFFGAVSYNVAGGNFGGPTNSESQQAQNIINAQFPSANDSGTNGIIVVLQNDEMYSATVQAAVLSLNHTLATDPSLASTFTGQDSIYSTEYSFLASLMPSLLSQVSLVNASVGSWDTASYVVANGTAASFASSPLFTVNASSLYSLLSSLGGASASGLGAAIGAVVQNETYAQYPLIVSDSLLRDFVSPDNGTMIVVYNFSVSPTASMIAAFRSDIASSKVPALGTYYVTGSAVLTEDISKTFGPVVGITVVPGVLASLAIVGILLLAPLAAIIPVLVGGIAIAIALPTIYLGIVDIGHGTLTFLTPALTILLTLGLAVDYSVLQLRRTKEERTNGKDVEQSVSVSVKWAGQAVLTAGITVVVAYIVMAVANVPLFSGVGTSIAIAVSILILAALTLLPALELTLGDRLFWPGLKRSKDVRSSKLSRISRVGNGTLEHKMAVIAIVSVLALGAVAVIAGTPTGSDILKLFPNFQSNEGLTVMEGGLGSSTVAPTVIVVTTSSPIVYGQDQFNQTLLNEIELISSTASSVHGVTTVSGPTRPYGAPFNYSAVQQLPEPERSQYLAGMLSGIGGNNETAQILLGLGSDAMGQPSIDALLKVESAVSSDHLPSGVAVYYGGETQSTIDSNNFLNTILPEVIAVLGASVYAILFIQLRSGFTPVRLVFTILCSVAFSSALLIAVYDYAQGLPILDFAPLFVVVTMLGVGIDYDIFFVTRIREEVLNGRTDDDAIKTALNKVWVTIFGLGLVLATVFGSLIATRIALLGEIGFVVAAAVLIDVGIVILFFVPALMGLAQRYNWWPSKIGRRSDTAVPDDREKGAEGA
jgi:putative drug exporter of the RND superfamily